MIAQNHKGNDIICICAFHCDPPPVMIFTNHGSNPILSFLRLNGIFSRRQSLPSNPSLGEAGPSGIVHDGKPSLEARDVPLHRALFIGQHAHLVIAKLRG